MKEYTLAFIFDLVGARILLIHKSSLNSPPSIYDKWNGIGGKLKNNETIFEGCAREVLEETGILLTTLKNFATLTDEKTFKIHCFFTFTNKISNYKQMTSEKLEIFNTKLLPINIPANLHYLISMALNFDHESADHLYIKELYF